MRVYAKVTIEIEVEVETTVYAPDEFHDEGDTPEYDINKVAIGGHDITNPETVEAVEGAVDEWFNEHSNWRELAYE